jgi:hypothetical protein
MMRKHPNVYTGETVRALISAGADLTAVFEESKARRLHPAAHAPKDAKDAKGRAPRDSALATSRPEAAGLLR